MKEEVKLLNNDFKSGRWLRKQYGNGLKVSSLLKGIDYTRVFLVKHMHGTVLAFLLYVTVYGDYNYN